MRRTAANLFEARTLTAVENEIATVKEIFHLQNAHELEEAELRYLPANGHSSKPEPLVAPVLKRDGLGLVPARP